VENEAEPSSPETDAAAEGAAADVAAVEGATPGADPALPLLWRHEPAVAATLGRAARRGPKQRLTVDDVVDAAIDLADRVGLAAVTVRSLAQRLGIGAMTVYTYVPGRQELIALMVDQAIGRTDLPPHPADLPARLSAVAEVQFAEYQRHPWLLDVSGIRPWLGPHASERYEWQLRAVDGLGLDDVEMDQAVTLLVSFAAGVARAAHEKRRAEAESGMTEAQWWEANHATLERVMSGRTFPLAERVGTAAGQTYNAATDQERELSFGLARVVAGLVAYVEDRRAGPPG
jgi:AcrR family transcriptional regulator